MGRVVLDFETRSRADLKKLSADPYARHASTQVLCLCYTLNMGAEVSLWVPGDIPPHDLFQAIQNGWEIHAHNAGFERALWTHICVQQLGWPAIADSQWRCSMAACCRLALPRGLAAAAKAVGLDVEKDDAGHRVMLKLCKPRKPTKNNPSEWHDDPADFARLYEYCAQDVRTQAALVERIPPLTPAELEVWQLDQRINQRGLPVDLEAIEQAIDVMAKHQASLLTRLTELTGGAVKTAKQVKALKDWLATKNCVLSDLSAGTVAAVLESDQVDTLDPDAVEALQIRQEAARSSTAKLEAMRDKSGPDSRVRGCFVYHGAHPGRWAGSGIQPQNFPRGVLKPAEQQAVWDLLPLRDPAALAAVVADPGTCISSILRGMIRSQLGKLFRVCDFAAIEARVLAWLARESDLLAVFFAGGDVYKEIAAKIYEVAVEQVNDAQRFIGKTAVLGLGYGMGAAKFRESVENYGQEITAEFAAHVVATYRAENPLIARLWKRLNTAAIRAVRTGKTQIVNGLVFECPAGAEWLQVKLPSGRQLHYYGPRVEQVRAPWDRTQWIDQVSYMGVNSITRKWQRQRTYGGKLTENIVQAIARDLLVAAMLRVEKAGHHIIATIHDEIIGEDSPENGTWDEFAHQMVQVPKWAEGCPIDVEGYEGERYKK